VTHYEQALVAVDHLPATPESQTLAIDLRFELRNALYPLGRIARDREHLLAVVPVAEALGDEHRFGWLLAYLARDASLLGDPGSALELGQRAGAIAERLGERSLRIVTAAYLGAAQHACGRYREAVRLLGDVVGALDRETYQERLGLPGPAAVFFRAWLVWALARLGEFADGQRHVREAIEIATRADHPLSLAVGHYSSGVLALAQLDAPRAVEALEHSLALCRRWSLRAWFPNIASHLGLAYARSARAAEGIELLRQAIDRISSPYDASSEYAMLAQALLSAGSLDEAQAHAARALALARAHQERGNEAIALWVQGEILAARQSVREAAACYESAATLAAELEMAPLLAQSRAGRARLPAA
jgi:tetratricopeptide (TPR) repeat protein